MGNPYGHPKPQYEGLSQKEKQAAYSKACYEKHKEERRAYGRKQSKEYREKNSDIVLPKKKDQWLRMNFKRDTKWYEETLVTQDGHCALCPAVSVEVPQELLRLRPILRRPKMYPEDFNGNTVLEEIHSRMSLEDKEFLESIHSGKSEEELQQLLETQRQNKKHSG